MFIFLSGAIIMKVVCGNFSRLSPDHLQYSFCLVAKGVKEFQFNYHYRALHLWLYTYIVFLFPDSRIFHLKNLHLRIA